MKDGYVKKSGVIAIAEKFVFTSEHDRKKYLDFVESCLIAVENLEQDEVKEIRNKAIDDVFDFLKTKRDAKNMKVNFDDLEIRKYKEQMKGGAE